MIEKNIKLSEIGSLRKLTEVPFKKKQTKTGYPSTYADDLKLLHELQVLQLEMELQNEELRADQFSLEELNKKYTELFEFAPNGFIALTPEGFIREVNLTGATLLGVNRNILIHQELLNFVLPEDREIFQICWKNLIETRDFQVLKIRLCRPDGHRLYVRLALSITENKGELQILLTMTDVTMQKQIEDAQSFLLGFTWSKSGKNFFESLAEYLSKSLEMDCVSIIKRLDDRPGIQTVAIYLDGHHKDNVTCTLLDTPFDKVLEQKYFCFPNSVRELFPHNAVLQKIEAESYAGVTIWGSGGNPIGQIAVISRKPLTDPLLTEMVLKQVSIRAASELEHRQLEEAIIKSRDELDLLVKERTAELQKANELLRNEITIRKQQEHSLIIAEEKYRTVADFTYNWETWISPDREFIYVSPSCNRITGYTVDEFINDPDLFIKIAHPDDREIIKKYYNEEINENASVWSHDFRIITRHGEERWVGHHCQPVFDANGKFLGKRGSTRDITQRKMAERVLIDSQRNLRELTQRMDAITEEERTRIAREIHDELGHLLTALKLDIEGLINQSEYSVDMVKSELDAMIDMIDSLIDSVRKIATDLRPGILDHLGLFPAIEWQIRQFRLRTKMCCSFAPGEMDVTFDKNETSIIFRILQEILTNVTRHSNAKKVNVSLTKRDDYFVLKVVDNGVGFEPNGNNQTSSLGLMGMQERALSIGGEIQIESAPGKGTAITFLLRKK